MLVDDNRLQIVLNRTPPPANPWAEPQHESLEGVWWIGEVFPKRVYDPITKTEHWKVNLGKHRTVPHGAVLPRPLLERLRTPSYLPPNLSDSFKAKVRALPSVPDSLKHDSSP